MDSETKLGLWLNMDRAMYRRSLPITIGIAVAMSAENLDESYFENFVDDPDQAKMLAHRIKIEAMKQQATREANER